MIYCLNHGGREAEFHCAQCQIGYCRDCVNVKEVGRSKVDVCPRCGNPVTDLTPFKPVAPFWAKISDILAWPIRDNGYYTILAWALFATVMLFIARLGFRIGGLLGLIGGFFIFVIYASLLISYFWRIIARAEDGKFDVPEFTQFEGVGTSLAWPLVQFLVASIASFLPIPVLLFIFTNLHGGLTAAFNSSAAPLYTVLIVIFYLVGLALLPMAFLVMGVFRRALLVFNYWFLIQQVLKIPVEYLILLGFLVALSILQGIAVLFISLLLQVLGDILGGFLSYPVFGAVQLYALMIFGHLLGYLAYQTRYKLKWWPECQEEPVFMVAGRPLTLVWTGQASPYSAAGAAAAEAAIAAGAAAVAARSVAPAKGPAAGAPAPVPGAPPPVMDEELARKINDGMAMIDHGRHQEALDLFKEILAGSPDHLGALRGAVAASIKLNDKQGALSYAKKQAAVLARQQAFDALWEMFSETSKAIPEFSLASRETMMLSRWLDQSGKCMDSAKVLREFASKNPDDPMAPKALYQCGELLWKKCQNPQTAAQMFDYILKRYPNVAFADQVRLAISQIKPE